MARYRTVDGQLWRHRDISRASLEVGWLYAYLITAEADDEGRFVADAWAITEGCFSSAHGVTDKETEAALRYLNECGRLLLYEVNGVRYGFLTGWYEHQYIKSDRRQSSPLPPPPCEVSSWQKADEIRAACAKERGWSVQKITYQEAVRWHVQGGFQSASSLEPEWKPKGRIGRQSGTTLEPDWKPEVEVEGEVEKEGEGEDELPPSAFAELIDKCVAVLEPISGSSSSAAAEQILMNCQGTPRWDEVIYECCASLASSAIEGKSPQLSWLPDRVASAVRRLKKTEEREQQRGQQPTPRSSYEAALAEVEALANAKFADLPEPASTRNEGVRESD